MDALGGKDGELESLAGQRIAIIHNFYQQPGGEDEVFRSEADLLAARGHEVLTYTVDNTSIRGSNPAALARNTIWNQRAYARLRALFRERQPRVAHFHNTFPLISPAAYYAAREEGVAVVQTLHNFRLCCPNGLLFRDGRICEDCVGREVAWPGVVHSCYRGSRAASAVTAAMLAFHRARGTWHRLVGAYVALSQFARTKFVAGGLPAERIHVKPNFISGDPGPGAHDGHYGLFVGRLSSEKGVETLLAAWAQVGNGRTLKIVGSGPLEHLAAQGPAGVEWLGWQPRERVLELMKEAAFLVLPSECYENFPMTLVEAYATGLPVIGSTGGSIAELITDFGTGRLFPPGDVGALAEMLAWALAHEETMRACGSRARCEFQSKYTAAENYNQLLQVYRSALAAPERQ